MNQDKEHLGREPDVPRTALLSLLGAALAWTKWSAEDWTALGVSGEWT